MLKGELRVQNLHTPIQKDPKRDVQYITPVQRCDVTPDSSQGVRQKAWRVRKKLPTDSNRRLAVLQEIIRIENGARRKLSYNNKRTSLTQEIIKITSLRQKKKFSQLETTVDGIRKKYKSLRNAHKLVKHDLTWKRFHKICRPKEKLHDVRRIKKKEEDEVIELYNDPSVTMSIPFKRHSKKRFMIISLSEAYQKYIMKKKLSGERILSMSSFHKLKPKNVRVKKMIPFNVCTCDTCTNYTLYRDALIANGIKGVSRKTTEATCATMCPLSKDLECDVLSYPRACIYRECNVCDQQNTIDVIKKKNPGYKWEKIVSWHRWQSVKKNVNGKECSGFERIKFSGSAEELLQLYALDSQEMPLHLLNQEWQRIHFCENRRKLKKGQVLMVIDFTRNYSHVAQNEPQSAHWDRRQTTMHPICVNFRCTDENCNKIVTLEIVCFSEDLKHDPFAVKSYEEATENYLRKIGVRVNCIFQWSDNCTYQYKSKYTFDILSQSVTPKMRNYYGAKHGKSAADGIIGRLKMKIDQEVRSGTTLETTEQLYNYCINKLETQSTVGCQHYRRHYILINEIPRPERNEPVTVTETMKIHSVRSTGIPGVIEKQELSCMCDVCLEGGDKCQNSHLVLGWTTVDLFKRKGEDFQNTHWPKVHNTRGKSTRKSRIRKKKATVMDLNMRKECDRKSRTRKKKTTVEPSVSSNRKTQEKTNKQDSGKKKTNPKSGKKKTETTWTDIADDLGNSTSYEDLERRVQKVSLQPCVEVDKIPYNIGENTVHHLTKELYPSYIPKGYDPICAYGDGNCYPRSISLIGYGDENHHREIRAMLAVVGVRFKDFFLDNSFLNLGTNFKIDLAEYYAITSESYTIHARDGDWTRETIERIYESEVLNSTRDGNYCGMWQVYQAANVLGRPIMSIFPHPGMMEEFRRRTNRLVYPIRIYKRDKEPVAIMWTKSHKEACQENHFVPLFKM